MDCDIQDFMERIKKLQIDRKLKEKMNRHDAKDWPLPKEFVNNLDIDSDSSDDNLNKKINNYQSDKGEKYVSSKMPNLNSPPEMWSKIGNEEKSKNLGAVPKKRFPQNNKGPKQNNNNNNNNNNFIPRRKRDNSTESNKSCSSQQRRPNSRGWPGPGPGPGNVKNDEGKRRETDWNRKVSNRSSNSNVKLRYPFYYKVPENPVEANPLPPGTYLVIPQTVISLFPLQVVSHPQGDSSEKNHAKGKGDSIPSEDKNDEKKESNKGCFGKNKQKETGGDEDGEEERRPSDVPGTDLDANKNPPGSHNREKLSIEKVRSIFAQCLPFYDTDRVLYEFYERGISLEKFVDEMIQLKRNEIQERIFEEFPDIDIECLEEYITDALENYTDVENFIQDRKRKKKEELLGSLTREHPEIDIKVMEDIYYRFEGI